MAIRRVPSDYKSVKIAYKDRNIMRSDIETIAKEVVEKYPDLKLAFKKRGFMKSLFSPPFEPISSEIQVAYRRDLTPDNCRNALSIYKIYLGKVSMLYEQEQVRCISEPGNPRSIKRIVCSEEAYEKLATELAERFGLDEIETDY